MDADDRCNVTLNAVDDGRTVDFRPEEDTQETVVLDPSGAGTVYLANVQCVLRVAKAP